MDIGPVKGEFQRIHRFGQRAIAIGKGDETAVDNREKPTLRIKGVEILRLAAEQLERDRALIEHQMQGLFHQQGKLGAADGQRTDGCVDFVGLLFHRPGGKADNAGQEPQGQPLLPALGIINEGIQRDFGVRSHIEHSAIVQTDRRTGGVQRAYGFVGEGPSASFAQGEGFAVIAAFNRVGDGRE